MKERLLILGSGPAGLTAAIYAARAGLSPLVIEGMQPGGQLVQTAEVENFPGFPEPVSGSELMDRMRKQAERCGARFAMDEAVAADLRSSPKKITLAVGGECEAGAVIICTGAAARWTGAPGEARLRGRGVSACATCDGAFFKGRDVAVVGGGDTALSDAIYLARICRSVTVVHRRDALRASKALQDRAKADPAIRFEWNAAPAEFLGGDRLEGLLLKDVATGATRVLKCDGAFVAVGHAPETAVFEGQIDMEDGYIATGGAKTSIPGVFAAGDVADRRYKQAIVAAGAGAAAALEAERYLA